MRNRVHILVCGHCSIDFIYGARCFNGESIQRLAAPKLVEPCFHWQQCDIPELEAGRIDMITMISDCFLVACS